MTPLKLEAPLRATPADRRLLPEGRIAGPMPLVIAIMMCLTALAVAAGLGLGRAAQALGSDLSSRISIQVIEANPRIRDAQAERIVELLRAQAGVSDLKRLSEAEMGRLLAPWLGGGTLGSDVPVPALIDAELSPTLRAHLPTLTRNIRAVAPAARVDDQAATVASLGDLIGSLRWLAFALVLLMATASVLTVVLASRAALNTHRSTIDVMHLLGATDLQIARLFQRRIGIDAFSGALIGLAVAAAVLLLMGQQLQEIGSELLGSFRLPWRDWATLLVLPVAAAAVATGAARWTVLAALRKIL